VECSGHRGARRNFTGRGGGIENIQTLAKKKQRGYGPSRPFRPVGAIKWTQLPC